MDEITRGLDAYLFSSSEWCTSAEANLENIRNGDAPCQDLSLSACCDEELSCHLTNAIDIMASASPALLMTATLQYSLLTCQKSCSTCSHRERLASSTQKL